MQKKKNAAENELLVVKWNLHFSHWHGVRSEIPYPGSYVHTGTTTNPWAQLLLVDLISRLYFHVYSTPRIGFVLPLIKVRYRDAWGNSLLEKDKDKDKNKLEYHIYKSILVSYPIYIRVRLALMAASKPGLVQSWKYEIWHNISDWYLVFELSGWERGDVRLGCMHACRPFSSSPCHEKKKKRKKEEA